VDQPEDVLVVDDDTDMAEVIMLVLSEAGYPTRSAANGLQALEAAKAKKPALVLLDMLMPVMDGWECARELRHLYGHSLPIVVVTAAEHVEARGDEIDAEDVLPKPFEMTELLRVVGRYVHQPARSSP
jgi:two-component system, OmpR family, response regulator